jgi:hypothetical protein
MHAAARRDKKKDTVCKAIRWDILSTGWQRIQVNVVTNESVERGVAAKKM